MIIGLTGRTGSGKSLVAKFFEQNGFTVLDFDLISRDTTKKGSLCLLEIEKQFGSSIITEGGELDRKSLGKIVFADNEKLAILNQITHKYILKEAERLINESTGRNLILDAPLLFEAELERKCDITIGVVASDKARIERICKRDNIDVQTAKARLDKQKSDCFFRDHCDFIVENNTDTKYLNFQLQHILRSIINDSNI